MIKKRKEAESCRHKMHGSNLCGRQLYDDDFCIFHSKDLEKKKKHYNAAFLVEFKRQEKKDPVFDFTGFIFPNSISFEDKVFLKNTYFSYAKFLGEETNFKFTKFFGKETYFNHTEFNSKETDFTAAEFRWRDKEDLSPPLRKKSPIKSGKVIKVKSLGGSEYLRKEKQQVEEMPYPGEESGFHYSYSMNNDKKYMGVSRVKTKTSFHKAKFEGEHLKFNHAKFWWITSFVRATFQVQRVEFVWTRFVGKETYFDEAKFNCSELNFQTTALKGRTISFMQAYIKTKKTIFNYAQIIGDYVSFTGTVFNGKDIIIEHTKIEGKEADFSGAKFLPTNLKFNNVKFNSNIIDFSDNF
jgi:hypothetical protein